MICYDITDNCCRRHVTDKLLSAGAYRVQESVFEGWFERRDVLDLYANLSKLIQADGGSLRVYPIKVGEHGRWSRGPMPLKVIQSAHWVC